MTSLWRHLWPNYDTLDFKILTQGVKLLGERVLQVWWWCLHWFRRYRKKTRGGLEIAPPVGRGLMHFVGQIHFCMFVNVVQCWIRKKIGGLNSLFDILVLSAIGIGNNFCYSLAHRTFFPYILPQKMPSPLFIAWSPKRIPFGHAPTYSDTFEVRVTDSENWI